MIEAGGAVAGGFVGFFQSGGDPVGAFIGGMAVAFALGIGFHSIAIAPYRLYRERVPPDPSEVRERLTKAAMIGRVTMGFAVKSDEDFTKWKALKTAFGVAFGQCKPLMDAYTWQRIGNVSYNPKVAYPSKYNDEHGAQWLELQAVVNAIDQYIDHMDTTPFGRGRDS